MSPDLKKKWIENLKSGEFKKGKYFLKKQSMENVYHCCIGVLLECLDPKAFSEVPYVEGPFDSIYGIQFPNEEFLKIVGLSNNDIHYLTALNDVKEKTFAEIAKWIETNI